MTDLAPTDLGVFAFLPPAVSRALPRLMLEEGFRAQKYLDTKGIETIGYGFNIQAGISQYAAQALMTAQTVERHQALVAYPWYAGLDPVRQSVIVDLSFNAGVSGLLHYVHMIAA